MRAIRRGLGVRTQYLRCADDVAATRSGISPHIDLSRSALNSKVWSFTLAPTAMSRRTMSISAASPPIAVEANQGVKAILQPPVNLADGDKAAIIQARWRPHLGVMLSAFGVFWTGEGLGIAWPGQDLSLLLFAAFVSQSGSDWRFARAEAQRGVHIMTTQGARCRIDRARRRETGDDIGSCDCRLGGVVVRSYRSRPASRRRCPALPLSDSAHRERLLLCRAGAS
jgi:hypothetical protein